MTATDTAVQVYAWALLLTLLRVRIADLEDQLAGLHRSYEELEEVATTCRLLHSGPRPEVRRG